MSRWSVMSGKSAALWPRAEMLVLAAFAAVVLSASVGRAASIRPAGDPAKQRVIWADGFDFYNQWAYDNSKTWVDFRGDADGSPGPSGGLHNGYYPPGSSSGSVPTRAPYCDTNNKNQVTPAPHEMARAMWITTDRRKAFLGSAIPTPGGMLIDTGEFEAMTDGAAWCAGSGQKSGNTIGGAYGEANYTWATGGSFDAMTMFQHNFTDRIQYIDPSKGAINGSDAHPLVLIFDVQEVQQLYPEKDNFYIELSLDGDHAPTDYVWRGDVTGAYPGDGECCPTGPFPIICQQTREINGSNSEDGTDLVWLNAHCPPLSSKTWHSVAFGLMAIMDKDPCACLEQGSGKHVPTVDHYSYFDGNHWRQLRSSREAGLTQSPPTWDTTGLGGYDPNMARGGGTCGNFSYPAENGVGQSTGARVYIKITTNDMLIYTHSESPTADYVAAITRAYKGPFNMVSIGVGPGCELDPGTGDCKAGSTKKPLTYSRTTSDGYNRTFVDSMAIYDGELTTNTTDGSCCVQAGTCSVMNQAACQTAGGVFGGPNSTCATANCCPHGQFVWADKNADGDVDMDDFAAFQKCYTGLGGGVLTGCSCFNRDSDNDVDADDFTAFGKCATGSNIPWSQAVTPNCVP